MTHRKSRHVIAIAAIAGLFVSSWGVAQPTEDPPFDPDLFGEAIFDTFSGNVKGFAVAITDSDGLQAASSGGWAQEIGDGGVPMNTGVYSGIGSVSKMLSGVALLNLMDKHVLSEASVQEQLDMKIWDKLPQKWQDAYANNNVADITYRQLLQHKAGFRIDDPNLPASANGRRMQWMLQQDVNPWDMDVRSYNNFSFAILKFLIPAIAFPDDVATLHDIYESLDIDTYSIAINLGYGLLYEQYMMEEIFPNAVDGPISASCRPVDELPADSYAKHYASVTAAVGFTLNDVGNPCISQGSWYLRARDLARFARTYAFTNIYIGPTTRASLFDWNNPDDRLLYNFTIMNDDFGLAQNEFAYHGGTQGNYRAALVELPHGYFGAGLANSQEFDSVEVAQAILDAFEFAIEDTPPTISPTLLGILGNAGWYLSNVTIRWEVDDPESEVSSTTGCGDSILEADTDPAGQVFTCNATSAGGTSSRSVTVRRDVTQPSANVAGVEDGDSFAAVDPPTVTCVALDPSPGSGILNPSPAPSITDDGGGFFTVSCLGEDVAGNRGVSASVTYKLVSLDVIVDEVMASSLNRGVQNSLLSMLDKIEEKLDRGQIDPAVNLMMAFEEHVISLIAEGTLPAAEGDVLLADIRVLIQHYS